MKEEQRVQLEALISALTQLTQDNIDYTRLDAAIAGFKGEQDLKWLGNSTNKTSYADARRFWSACRKAIANTNGSTALLDRLITLLSPTAYNAKANAQTPSMMQNRGVLLITLLLNCILCCQHSPTGTYKLHTASSWYNNAIKHTLLKIPKEILQDQEVVNVKFDNFGIPECAGGSLELPYTLPKAAFYHNALNTLLKSVKGVPNFGTNSLLDAFSELLKEYAYKNTAIYIDLIRAFARNVPLENIDTNRNNILHYIYISRPEGKDFEAVINTLKPIIGDDIIKRMLQAKNEQNETPLDMALKSPAECCIWAKIQFHAKITKKPIIDIIGAENFIHLVDKAIAVARTSPHTILDILSYYVSLREEQRNECDIPQDKLSRMLYLLLEYRGNATHRMIANHEIYNIIDVRDINGLPLIDVTMNHENTGLPIQFASNPYSNLHQSLLKAGAKSMGWNEGVQDVWKAVLAMQQAAQSTHHHSVNYAVAATVLNMELFTGVNVTEGGLYPSRDGTNKKKRVYDNDFLEKNLAEFAMRLKTVYDPKVKELQNTTDNAKLGKYEDTYDRFVKVMGKTHDLTHIESGASLKGIFALLNATVNKLERSQQDDVKRGEMVTNFFEMVLAEGLDKVDRCTDGLLNAIVIGSLDILEEDPRAPRIFASPYKAVMDAFDASKSIDPAMIAHFAQYLLQRIYDEAAIVGPGIDISRRSYSAASLIQMSMLREKLLTPEEADELGMHYGDPNNGDTDTYEEVLKKRHDPTRMLRGMIKGYIMGTAGQEMSRLKRYIEQYANANRGIIGEAIANQMLELARNGDQRALESMYGKVCTSIDILIDDTAQSFIQHNALRNLLEFVKNEMECNADEQRRKSLDEAVAVAIFLYEDAVLNNKVFPYALVNARFQNIMLQYCRTDKERTILGMALRAMGLEVVNGAAALAHCKGVRLLIQMEGNYGGVNSAAHAIDMLHREFLNIDDAELTIQLIEDGTTVAGMRDWLKIIKSHREFLKNHQNYAKLIAKLMRDGAQINDIGHLLCVITNGNDIDENDIKLIQQLEDSEQLKAFLKNCEERKGVVPTPAPMPAPLLPTPASTAPVKDEAGINSHGLSPFYLDLFNRIQNNVLNISYILDNQETQQGNPRAIASLISEVSRDLGKMIHMIDKHPTHSKNGELVTQLYGDQRKLERYNKELSNKLNGLEKLSLKSSDMLYRTLNRTALIIFSIMDALYKIFDIEPVRNFTSKVTEMLGMGSLHTR